MKKLLFLSILISTFFNSQILDSKTDCKLFNEKREIKFKVFKSDNQHIEEIYNKINKKVVTDLLKKISKKELRNNDSYIYIKYLNNRAYFDRNSCFDRINEEYNFLITRFWNKSVLEFTQKKYDKEIYLSTKIPNDDFDEYRKIIDYETYNFIKKYYDPKIMKVKILASENSKFKIPIPIEVLFKTPYKIEINDTKNITTYEYKNNKWEILK